MEFTIMKKQTTNLYDMKLKALFSTSAILFVFLLMSGTAFAADPIQISTFEQLMAIDNSIENLSKDYILMNDIDVQNSTLFKPIGSNFDYTTMGEHKENPFTGTFNGNGYTISNITILDNTMTGVGLFGSTEGASISNLSLKNINLTGQHNVGGLVGMANTTSIMNCSVVNSDACLISGNGCVGGFVGVVGNSIVSDSYATSAIIGYSSVGGFVGAINNSTVFDSYATGNVEGVNSVGGFVGLIILSSVSESYATGNIEGKNDVGGFVGGMWDSSSVSDSYAIGNAEGKEYVGGFVGSMQHSSSIFNSYAIGNAIIKATNETKSAIGNAGDLAVIKPTDICFGGFAGYMHNNSSISKSYATGNAEGKESIGGFVGGMSESSMVSESYATGNATGSNNVGGFVGNMSSSSISYCYAIGNSKADGNNIGGFAGYQKSSTIISCFSPTEAGHDNGLGIVKPATDLKKKATFTAIYPIIPANLVTFSKPWSISSSLDSNSTWYVDENNDYPKLLWNSSSPPRMGLIEISILIIIGLLIFSVVTYIVFFKKKNVR